MTAPTSLEALAAEWERSYAAGESIHPKDCIRQLRAYLAERPASDLEQRLKGAAARRPQSGFVRVRPELLDGAADALAHEKAEHTAMVTALLRSNETKVAELERLHEDALNERDAAHDSIAELESKLTSAEASIAGLHDMRERLERELAEAREYAEVLREFKDHAVATAEAAEARLDRIADLCDKAEASKLGARFVTTMTLRGALGYAD